MYYPVCSSNGKSTLAGFVLPITLNKTCTFSSPSCPAFTTRHFLPNTLHTRPRLHPLHHHRSAMPTMTAASSDLLIVGSGVLGRLVSAEWYRLHPQSTVVGETRTTTSHSDLSAQHIRPALAGTTSPCPSFVVFCAPPSGGTPDYAAAVAATVARAPPDARVVFTSSASVHGTVPLVTETTPPGVAGRAAVLANAERAVLSHPNGVVVRLSGLYTRSRGAHSYWLRIGEVTAPQDGTLNLIHYEDAAHAVVCALLVPTDDMAAWPQRTCLAAANRYVTRRQVCEAALRHPDFQNSVLPKFSSTEEPQGRTYHNEWTRRVLQWTPRWESFEDFMLHDATNSAVESAAS